MVENLIFDPVFGVDCEQCPFSDERGFKSPARLKYCCASVGCPPDAEAYANACEIAKTARATSESAAEP